ncbi:hypothetical protein NDU88_002066 [Pleurodeles waltl]|uniref:Uncharacterized protein n=1 Tax=Pleurodeles waltl TaxID=8319 RepID=A0AAV7VA60_PLEWA|nr:hypothetical protein NDU88_002066 [Pleurodeles waltl]
MAAGHDAAAVRAALRIIGKAGHSNLLWPGVLDQALVGMTSTMQVAAHCLAAAVVACRSPSGGVRRRPRGERGNSVSTPMHGATEEAWEEPESEPVKGGAEPVREEPAGRKAGSCA